MDEEKLKKILGDMNVPPADDNARKRAVNLSVAEFKSLKNNDKKSSQGNSILSRLISRTTSNGRNSMEQRTKQRLMYGGMATAMAVVLIVGVTFTQLQTFTEQTAISVEELQILPDLAKTDLVAAVAEDDGSFVDQEFATAYTPAKQKEEAEVRENYAADTAVSNADPTAPPMALMRAEKKDRLSSNMAARQNYSGDKSISGAIASMEMAAPYPSVMAPTDIVVQPGYHDEGHDKFEDFEVSPVKQVSAEPISTFSIDVDTASYSFVRGQLNNGVLPQKDAVRVEEMINYFDYDYALPETKAQPFKPTVTVLGSPWNPDKKLVHIGIKGFDIEKAARPHSNLVFLLDVSGSMNEPNKLPLVKNSLKMLLDSLDENDKVSIVVYAGAAGMVLEPTKGSDKAKIIAAIDNLQPGGSTAGAEGINLAYQLAEQNFDKEGVNRVILATDGDFNVGITNPEELQDFVERKRGTGIFLSVFGFGQGNYNDSMMQTLAQNGNGAAAYIDNLNEARKVLVEEASSTLFPIAKDVKIQVEFNPALVSEYRLVGYETRALKTEDFNNDKVDAGEIGAGHAVTAIYEITPVGATPSIDPSRYTGRNECKLVRVHQNPGDKNSPLVEQQVCSGDAKPETRNLRGDFSNELAFLKIRYKLPEGDTSKLITTPISATDTAPLNQSVCPPGAKCSMLLPATDAGWAVAVAGFAQILKGDPNVGKLTYDDVINLAQANKGEDTFGYRAEFINLVRLAKTATAQ